ncbi:hypothetical protein FFLO_06792 [Filobasidium floriforme]|uniref:Uncharacterized protein n=1 Tax=Filobasidium floriforme TaxID=5210 RepID=A0A8K0NLS9_9TREE|nr:hypothetical protein FFLO_06792 [Filobasidium floriforme]
MQRASAGNANTFRCRGEFPAACFTPRCLDQIDAISIFPTLSWLALLRSLGIIALNTLGTIIDYLSGVATRILIDRHYIYLFEHAARFISSARRRSVRAEVSRADQDRTSSQDGRDNRLSEQARRLLESDTGEGQALNISAIYPSPEPTRTDPHKHESLSISPYTSKIDLEPSHRIRFVFSISSSPCFPSSGLAELTGGATGSAMPRSMNRTSTADRRIDLR